MRRMTIVPIDKSEPAAIFNADQTDAFHMVSRLNCGEADVFENDQYKFSLRLEVGGLWNIFRRNGQG